MITRTQTKATSLLSSVFAAGLLLASSANAQLADPSAGPAAPAAAPQPEQPDPMQIQQTLLSIQQQLDNIQKLALEENPNLEVRAEKLDASILLNIEEQGIDVEKDAAKLEELEASLRSDELDAPTREKQMVEYQTISQKLMQARQQALRVPEIQEKIQMYRDDLLAAMEEQNSETPRLIAEMNSARIRMQQMQQEAAEE